MLDTVTTKATGPGESNHANPQPVPFLARKIWLPKLIYNALPFFYIAVGLLALSATVYINRWFWVVPHYLLFSAACLHMGFLISRRRRRARRDTDQS
ncbi:MAG: hypothetical protein KJO82_02655 [Gammaproteobacteria bacterium]|nr:hypothetical protein [Gammaproteobacteria bacterium]